MTEETIYPMVVKIIINDDGQKTRDDSWHYYFCTDSDRTLCGGEAFGPGESNCEYETRQGKVTCHRCIKLIKEFKSIRL